MQTNVRPENMQILIISASHAMSTVLNVMDLQNLSVSNAMELFGILPAPVIFNVICME